ncbi:ATP-binding protein [Streptomyces gobiensis]|uniref:ATP-binding protein n=1 Tax=Streptomyces gobiensis TaxID=2875706 RepID=UPI001E45C63D|nr:ATP-binding protein [Streptomyces gobiensis]UGY92178.1 ATP-binding protein [Streptomyces gobiensis]
MLTATPSSVQPASASRTWTPPQSAPTHDRSFVHWTLRPTVAAVPNIRARVRAVLEDWQIAPTLTDMLLLAISELVSNAVRHAGAVTDRLRTTVTLGGGWLQLEVADGDPSLPRVCLKAGPEAESGRGLMIIGVLAAELSGEMVAVPRGSGKVVKVRVPAA